MGKGTWVEITSKSKDGIKIQKRVEALHAIRVSQGAKPEDPFLTAWDLDSLVLSNKPLKNGQALAERLKLHLAQLKSSFPQLSINPHSYGMHSLRRGGVVAAWEAGIDIDKLKAHGRWRSDAIQSYLTANLKIKLSVSQSM